MATLEFYIHSLPYNCGLDIDSKVSLKEWTSEIQNASRSHGKILGPCRMIANFVIPEEAFAKGPDLIKLFTPIYDVLKTTLFSSNDDRAAKVDRVVINKVTNPDVSAVGVKIQIDWDEPAVEQTTAKATNEVP